MSIRTFLVNCFRCSAKVAANQDGQSLRTYYDEEAAEPFAERILVGKCPHCSSILAIHQTQIEFEGITAEHDLWSDPVRIHPNPQKTFSSDIPKVVRSSIGEAQKCIHAGANTAACVMLRRTMEAICVDVLTPLRDQEIRDAKTNGQTPKKIRPLMLGEGLDKLHENKFIDERLFSWGKQIQLIGNKSAHAVDIDISRHDATDLLSFVIALIEYIYDLTLRYHKFLERHKEKAVVAQKNEGQTSK